MRSVRSSGTAPELMLATILDAVGVHYELHPKLCGLRPDFVLPEERVVVFVDGCFWHGCPHHRPLPKSNRDFWLAKVRGNRRRDRRNTRTLKTAGWTVVRIWEHTVVRTPGRALASVRRAMARARAARSAANEDSPSQE